METIIMDGRTYSELRIQDWVSKKEVKRYSFQSLERKNENLMVIVLVNDMTLPGFSPETLALWWTYGRDGRGYLHAEINCISYSIKDTYFAFDKKEGYMSALEPLQQAIYILT